MAWSSSFLKFLLFLTSISLASALSCFSCYDQDWNWGPCANNFTLCKPFQDTCTSYVAFHSPVKYTPRGDRIHHISKGCDTSESCLRRQLALEAAVCERTSYNDWSCVECCQGDLCNFYITLGASGIQGSLMTALLLMLASYFTL